MRVSWGHKTSLEKLCTSSGAKEACATLIKDVPSYKPGEFQAYWMLFCYMGTRVKSLKPFFSKRAFWRPNVTLTIIAFLLTSIFYKTSLLLLYRPNCAFNQDYWKQAPTFCTMANGVRNKPAKHNLLQYFYDNARNLSFYDNARNLTWSLWRLDAQDVLTTSVVPYEPHQYFFQVWLLPQHA